MKQKILAAYAAVQPQLRDIARQMYERPELGNQEFFAVQLHTEFMEQQGFAVTRRLCGLETGYRADYVSAKPGPHIAVLAEFDALPNVGHGCGHNLVGTAALGAAVALKPALDELGGSVTVYGAPAEETDGGKVVFAAQGQFDDVDIAMLCHPANEWTRSGEALALMPVQFEFFGKSSHAASAPDKGINALDAALVTMTAINAMREHIRGDARIHGIIKDGGKAANIVPDYTCVQYYVRAAKTSYRDELVERVKNCGRAGALATGCRVEISQYETAYGGMLTNELLSKTFGEELEAGFGVVMQPPRSDFGSTDLGDVSLKCPTIQPMFDITDNNVTVAAHSREMADATQTDFAAEATRQAACSMAFTALRVLQDPALLEAMWEEYRQAEK